MSSTTDNTSATPSGSGVAEAAEAWQDVLTPGRSKHAAATDTDDDDEPAQQAKKPTAKQPAAKAKPEAEEGDEDPETDPEANEDDEADPDADAEQQGDEAGEDESEEGESESEEGEEGADDAPDLTQEFTVTLADGTEDSVTLEELVKGYHRQKDYTRKTQAVAEERRQTLAERQEASALRVQYARGLEQLQAAMQQMTPQEPDWEALKAVDPGRYAVEYTDWQRQQDVIRQIEAERRSVEAQEEHEREANRREAVARGREWLLSQIPEWKDSAKAQAERASMKAYAAKLGFSAEELSAVDDPRAVYLIRQAMLYAKLQEKKPMVIKTKVKTPVNAGTKTPVLKPLAVKQPASKNATRLQDARKRHSKEQSIDSAAGFFQTLLS